MPFPFDEAALVAYTGPNNRYSALREPASRHAAMLMCMVGIKCDSLLLREFCTMGGSEWTRPIDESSIAQDPAQIDNSN